MQLQHLFEAATITGVVTAYHGGNGFDGDFDLKYSGHGEGYRILGPGIYFATHEGIAARYTKYATKAPSMYTVQIDTTDFYQSSQYPTPANIESMEAIAKELGFPSADDVPRSYNSLTDGRGFIGDVVKQVGHKKAQQLLIKHGIKGAVEHLDADIWEICVFDLRVVHIIDRKQLEQ